MTLTGRVKEAITYDITRDRVIIDRGALKYVVPENVNTSTRDGYPHPFGIVNDHPWWGMDILWTYLYSTQAKAQLPAG